MKTSALLLQTINNIKNERNKYKVHSTDDPWNMLFDFFQEVVDNQIDIKNNDWQFLNDYFNDNVHNDFTQRILIIDNMTHHSQEQIRICCSILNDQIEYENITNVKLKKLYILKLFCFVYCVWKYNNIDNGQAFDNDFINDTFVKKYNEDKIYIDMLCDFNENSQCNEYKDFIVNKLNDEQLNEFEMFISAKYNSYKKQMYVSEQSERRHQKCKKIKRCIISGLIMMFVGYIIWHFKMFSFWNILSFFDRLTTHIAMLVTMILPLIFLICQEPDFTMNMHDLYRSVVGYFVECKKNIKMKLNIK